MDERFHWLPLLNYDTHFSTTFANNEKVFDEVHLIYFHFLQCQLVALAN